MSATVQRQKAGLPHLSRLKIHWQLKLLWQNSLPPVKWPNSLTSYKVLWQFPDLEKISFFPDFSPTRRHPERFIYFAIFFLWSLPLLHVNIKLDSLWTHLETMSLSFSFQYKRYYAEMFTLVWDREQDPLYNCPNHDGCSKTNFHPPFSIVHVTGTCTLTVPTKFIRIAR